MAANHKYFTYKGRACWTVAGQGKAAGLLFKCGFSSYCTDIAPTRYLTRVHRPNGIKLQAFMNWL